MNWAPGSLRQLTAEVKCDSERCISKGLKPSFMALPESAQAKAWAYLEAKTSMAPAGMVLPAGMVASPGMVMTARVGLADVLG
jgi:hypothetical protein